MPALQQRSVRHTLVDALLASGARRTADRVRMACWSMGLGVEVDPMTLSLGSDASLFAIGQAISGRCSEILPHARRAPDGRPGRPPEPQGGGAVWPVRPTNRTAAYTRGSPWRTPWRGRALRLRPRPCWPTLSVKAEAMMTASGWLWAWPGCASGGASRSRRPGRASTEAADEAERCGGDPLLLADIYQDLAGIALNTAQPAVALTFARARGRGTGRPAQWERRRARRPRSPRLPRSMRRGGRARRRRGGYRPSGAGTRCPWRSSSSAGGRTVASR